MLMDGLRIRLHEPFGAVYKMLEDRGPSVNAPTSTEALSGGEQLLLLRLQQTRTQLGNDHVKLLPASHVAARACAVPLPAQKNHIRHNEG